MVHRIRQRKKYPSDLTDEQWATLGSLIPPAKQSKRGGRPRTVDMREVLKTLFYLNRSGCQWEASAVPHDLLPKSTVHDYFAQWRDDGTWKKWSRHCVSRPACKRGVSPRRVPSAAIAKRSRPPRWVVPSVGMMAARRSTGASGICWLLRWGLLLAVLITSAGLDDGVAAPTLLGYLTPHAFPASCHHFCGSAVSQSRPRRLDGRAYTCIFVEQNRFAQFIAICSA